MMKNYFLILSLLLCSISAKAQKEYPDIPISDSAYSDIKLLYPLADSAGYDGSSSVRPMTKYEFAVAVVRLYQGIISTDKEQQSHLNTTPQNGILVCIPVKVGFTGSRKSLRENPTVFAALIRLNKRFAPEIRQLISEPEYMLIYEGLLKGHLIEGKLKPPLTKKVVPQLKVAPPFSDVAENHWAYYAVEKLRREGIMVGYPDGKF